MTIETILERIVRTRLLITAARINTEARSWMALGYHPADLVVVDCSVCRWSWVELRASQYRHDCSRGVDIRLIQEQRPRRPTPWTL